MYLREILAAELITIEELREFQISAGVSIFDLLKVQRLFSFVSRVTKNHLLDRLKSEPLLVFRSLVPVFATDQFEQWLGWCLDKDAIRAVIKMLSWSSGASDLVDLQYRPILKPDGHYLAPLNTAGSINWYRNLAYTQRRRAADIAEEEAASRALTETLRHVSDRVRKGFETTLERKHIAHPIQRLDGADAV